MINESEIFADRFCPTRWTMNEPVAEKALIVYDKVMKVIQHYASLAPSKRPKDNSSYDNLVLNQHNDLIKVEIQVIKDIAHKTNGFLTLFQTDSPMVPFLAKWIEDLLRKLMRYFITKPVRKNSDAAGTSEIGCFNRGWKCSLAKGCKTSHCLKICSSESCIGKKDFC